MEVVAGQNQKQFLGKGISGSTLKLIAIITMFIDHLGAAVLGRIMWDTGYVMVYSYPDQSVMASWMSEHWGLYLAYIIMRMIGRVAFPIFIFLMVEGLSRTGNKWKYLGRMLLFVALSEIPFNLAFRGSVWDATYQSIYFTLSLGLLAMILCKLLEERLWSKKTKGWQVVTVVLSAGIIIGTAYLAEWLRTDYGAIGILCIMAIYLFRKNKLYQTIAGSLAFLWETTAPLAFIPIWFYNGKRGLKLKYVFYLFYPLHLLVLYWISYLMGLSSYPAL